MPVETVDLLFAVDNSNSMREKQQALADQLPRLLRALTSGDHDDDGEPESTPVTNLHLGVVSSDLGLPGIEGIPACAGHGDDGLLQTMPPVYSPECEGVHPSFINFFPAVASLDSVAAEVGCMVQLGTDGCGFEQQLESVLKALWPAEDVDPETGLVRMPNRMQFVASPTGENATGHGDSEHEGFLRIDPREGRSLLAVLLLTDEEDCSSADLRHFTPHVFLQPGDPLVEQDLNLRCYYNPQNLYSVERYVNGLRALRPGAEHLMVFGAIVGVPPELVTRSALSAVDFADDAARDAHYQEILDHPDMQQRPDPNRTREQGGNLVPSCITDTGRAYPPRRIVELARLFGAQGSVGSICQADLTEPVDAFLRRIASALDGATDPGIPGVCEPFLTAADTPPVGPDPAAPVGQACLPAQVPRGGFAMTDVYLEPSSTQCAGDDCIVFHLAGDPYNQCAPDDPPGTLCVQPAEVDARVYCTCKCWDPAGGPTCLCPEDYSCLDSNRAGATLPGGYCIKNGT